MPVEPLWHRRAFVGRMLAIAGVGAAGLVRGAVEESGRDAGPDQSEQSDRSPAATTVEPAIVGCPMHGSPAEFWLLRTTCAGTCQRPTGYERLEFFRQAGTSWQRVERDAFVLATGDGLPLSFFFHGYGGTADSSLEDTRLLARLTTCRGPMRWVAWSWPAEHRVGAGVVNNLDDKTCRARAQGYYLARLLSELNSTTRVSLVGHSFGTRPIAVALDGLMRGQVDHDALSKTGPADVQVALLASALETRAMARGGYAEQALVRVRRTFATFNTTDRTLHIMSHFLAHENLVGHTGIDIRRTSAAGPICQLNVQPLVGRCHLTDKLIENPTIAAHLTPYLTWNA